MATVGAAPVLLLALALRRLFVLGCGTEEALADCPQHAHEALAFGVHGLRSWLRARQRRRLHRRPLRGLGRGVVGGGRLGRGRGGELVARHAAFDFRGVVADAFDFEVRRVHFRRRHDDQVGGRALFDRRHVAALLVQQVGGDGKRHAGADDGAALLQRFLLDHAQNGERQGLDVADASLPQAARADLRGEVLQRRSQPLARHFHQPEARDAADLDARSVRFQRIAHLRFDGAVVAGRHHVDEVDDDQPADVAQPQLPGDLLGGLEIGVQGRLFDVGALGRARRIDVDGDQRFGGVDDDAAASVQLHFVLKGRLDLALDLEAVEQGHRLVVELDALLVLRHHRIDELVRLVEGLLGVDQHLADVRAQTVADGAHEDVVLLVQQRRGAQLGGGLVDGAVQLQQIVEVPLQIGGVPVHAGGAHDDAHAVGDVERPQGFAQRVAVLAFDAPGDARGAGVVGHQHQVAGGDAQESGERRPLVAALFLLDLDDQFLALVEHVADVDAAFLGRPLEAGTGDVLERQKAVPLRTELDEGGL